MVKAIQNDLIVDEIIANIDDPDLVKKIVSNPKEMPGTFINITKTIHAAVLDGRIKPHTFMEYHSRYTQVMPWIIIRELREKFGDDIFDGDIRHLKMIRAQASIKPEELLYDTDVEIRRTVASHLWYNLTPEKNFDTMNKVLSTLVYDPDPHVRSIIGGTKGRKIIMVAGDPARGEKALEGEVLTSVEAFYSANGQTNYGFDYNKDEYEFLDLDEEGRLEFLCRKRDEVHQKIINTAENSE